MRLKPRGTRVLLKRIDERELVFRGVVIVTPEQLEEQPVEAMVLEVGAGCRYVKPGERVLLNRYSSSDFEFAGETVCLVDEYEVLARVGGVEDAIQERGTAAVDAREQARDGGEVGKGNASGREAA
jgi:co-chaperonin GroES (HSP10)